MNPQKDKIALYQQFVRLEKERQGLAIRGYLEATLDYAEYCITSEFDKGSKQAIKYKKRREDLPEQYLLAYSEQTNLQKLEAYIRVVRFVRDVRSNQYEHERLYGDLQTSEAYTRSYNLKIWKRKTLKLDRQNNHMFCSKEDKVKIYNLDNYLIRESKNKDYYCFVLEALNEKPHIKSRTVHIGFRDIKLYNEWLASVREGVFECEKTRVLKELGIEPYQFLGIANRTILIENDDKLKHANSHNDSVVSKSDISILEALKEEQKHHVHKSQSWNAERKEQQKEKETKQQVSKAPSNSSIDSDKDERQQIGTITQQLLDSDGQQEALEEIQEQEDTQPTVKQARKRNLNLFHQILPEFELDSLTDESGFQLIDNNDDIRLFRSTTQPQRYKFYLTVKDADMERVFDPIAHMDTYLKWNTAIEDVSIKNLIRSENTAIVYQKHKAYSKIYRPRDFIFLRHVFKKDNNLYMVDKSLENANYPPFLTIVRGEVTCVWGILNSKEHIFVAADIEIKNQGYLNEGQDHNLSMMYLKGLFNIPSYLMQKGFRKDESVYRMFDLDWDIANNQHNVVVEENRQKRKSVMIEQSKREEFLQKKSESPRKFAKKKTAEEPEESSPPVRPAVPPKKSEKVISAVVVEVPPPAIVLVEKPSSIEKLREESRKEESRIMAAKLQEDVGELEFMPPPLQTHMEIKYSLDEQGLVRVPQDYLQHKYLMIAQPPSPMIMQEPINGHPIWKGQWIPDKAGCGIVFINQKKIDEQKGVLKFILTKIGKNLLSGKSILNISLPVDIFAPESNLERLAFAMTYAPIYLERAARESNPVEKFKSVVAFGITNSVLYLNMEKPFNPILGETFQGWMNGCPVYMEQVSHHPPIASFMLLGRGYKMSGSLESKVELHMNSGCGLTDGVYRIEFDDGTDICFITPGGEVSGLTYGDRKFNLVGKSYFWSMKHCLYLELVFDPNKKGFFSVSKKETTTDYFQGTLMEVTQEFLDGFVKNKKKRERPQPKDIMTNKYKASGVWCKELFCDSEKILDLDRDFGCKLEYDRFLLPSDGNWREDIAYRRLQDITRAQNEKQRLEVLQRKDRKLREAKHGKKH